MSCHAPARTARGHPAWTQLYHPEDSQYHGVFTWGALLYTVSVVDTFAGLYVGKIIPLKTFNTEKLNKTFILSHY